MADSKGLSRHESPRGRTGADSGATADPTVRASRGHSHVGMSCFHVHQERSSQPISLMKWSPRMDLIALVLETDEITLHRLEGWQRVWSISLGVKASAAPQATPSNSSSSLKVPKKFVSGLEWRPDGKVLAVGYQRNILSTIHPTNEQPDSSVALIEVESSEVIYVVELPSFTVSSLSWTFESPAGQTSPTNVPSTSSPKSQTEIKLNEFLGPIITDAANLPIPQLKALPKANTHQYGPIPLRKMTEENLPDMLKVESLKQLNVLAIGSTSGDVQLYALGLLKIAHIKGNSPVIAVNLSDSLTHLCIVTQEPGSNELKVSYYPLDNIHSNCPQYLAVALIYSRMLSLVRYTKECMLSILEIWEEIVIEIETKLSIYFKKSDSDPHPSAPSADEFFELLALGTASPSLENFLKEIGEKGLKRLNSSIEVTYSSIQKTVVTCLQRVAYHMIHLLNHLNGMASWKTEFSSLNLKPEQIVPGIHSAGSFLMKSVEFQQVIDTSIRNVKAFFRWLHNTIVRLHGSDATSAPEINKISQQELMLVAEFIEEHFETYEALNSGRFHHRIENIFTLDRVGQYLKDEPLSSHLNVKITTDNPWVKFVSQKFEQLNESWITLLECRDSISLFRHDHCLSLFQQHNRLLSEITESFTSLDLNITRTLSEKLALSSLDFSFDHPSPFYTSSHIANTKEHVLLSAFSPKSIVQNLIDGKGQVVRPEYPNCLILLKYPIDNESKTEVITVNFKETNSTDSTNLQVIAHEFYNQDSLFTLLVTSCRSHYFLALIPVICMNSGESCTKKQSSVFLDSTVDGHVQIGYRKMEGAGSDWNKLAVSGSRRLAFLAAHRKVKIFETDAAAGDEEEEGDEDAAETMRESPMTDDAVGSSNNLSQ